VLKQTVPQHAALAAPAALDKPMLRTACIAAAALLMAAAAGLASSGDGAVASAMQPAPFANWYLIDTHHMPPSAPDQMAHELQHAGYQPPAGHRHTGVAVTLQQWQSRFPAPTVIHSASGTAVSIGKSQLAADAGARSPAAGTQDQDGIPGFHSAVLRVLGVAADAAADAVRAAERWPPGSLAQQASFG
jgi:hypothetical protein